MKQAHDDLANCIWCILNLFSNKSFGWTEVAISNHLNLKDNVFCDFESTWLYICVKILHMYLYVIVQPFIPQTMYIYNTYAASDIIIRIIYSDYHQIWWHSLNIHSFFMPMSKHFFKRQPEQNLRVWVSSLQFPSKLHAKTWKSIKKTMRS